MKKIFLSLIAAFTILNAHAQGIVAAEYFLGTDPGPGQGQSIAITSSEDVLASFTLNSGLEEGVHWLYVRAKGENNIWSATERRLYFTVNHLEIADITQAEYFFDIDPGAGNATALSIAGGDPLNVNVAIPQSLGAGVHWLYIRTRANEQPWGQTERMLFYVQPDMPMNEIVAAEYFIDTDPGVGSGQSISIASGTNVIGSFAVINPYVSGTHTLFIRVKTASGLWSVTDTRTYSVCSIYGPIAAFDHFIDKRHVIFENHSQNFESFTWNFGDAITSTTSVSPNHEYPGAGNYTACFTAENLCGPAQHCEIIAVNGLQNSSPKYSSDSSTVYLKTTGVGFLSSDILKLKHPGGTTYTAEWTTLSSPGEGLSKFTWANAPHGFYDLILESVSGNDTLLNAFEIQGPVRVPISMTLAGRSPVRANRTNYYSYHFVNNSNETIFLLPIAITVEEGVQVNLLVPVYDDPLVPDEYDDMSFSNFYPYTDPDGVTKQIALIGIPNIPPGGSVDIPMSFLSPTTNCYDVSFTEWQQVYPNGAPSGSCTFLSDGAQCALSLLGLVPIVSCGAATFNLTCTVQDMIQDGDPRVIDLMGNFGSAIADCVAGLAPASAVKNVLEFVDTMSDLASAAGACSNMLTEVPVTGTRTICASTSFDPNEKYGIEGKTPENYVNRSAPLSYTIIAENLEDASAPAAQVIFTDTLDVEHVDISSVRIGLIQIGDSLIETDVHTDHYVQDIILPSLSDGHFVRYVFDLDTVTGVMTHAFYTYDSLNFNVDDDPLVGFLPPNIANSEGVVSVMFDVQPKPELAHLTAIYNQASIVFDSNAAILTSNFVNTIDTIRPVSAITPTDPFVQDTTTTLHFESTDAHAMVKDYFLQVSVNDGPFEDLITAYTADTFQFHGETGNNYRFMIRARDYANNLEDVHPSVDADISFVVDVNELFRARNIEVFPNPANDHLTISFKQAATNAHIKMYDAIGNLKYDKNKVSGKILEVDLASLASGLYYIQCDEGGKVSTVKQVVQ